jgi:hypothetical protein
MARRHRIIFCAALVLSSACGNKKEVEYAKRSLYDADFAIVYSAALEVTRGLYPQLNDNPGPGKISTAWHQVQYGNNQDDLSNQRTIAAGQGMNPGLGQSGRMSGVPTRLAYKRFFIRFDVTVLGGRPWRVKVVGHASEWDPGAAMPSELKGAQRPSWLDGRIDALTLAIYKRIKNFAVPMKDEPPPADPDDAMPKADPSQFAGIPAGAAKRLAAIKNSLSKRDYVSLRPQLHEDVVWSLGGGVGADAALAMWQADPATLDAMAAVISPACTAQGGKKVTCPGGEPQLGQYQLVLELEGDWKVTSFVRGE